MVDVIVDSNKERQDSFDFDSVTSIHDAGADISAILLAIMVDRGYLAYDQPVSKYWPEFARNGKEKILVSDVLKHEAGLSRLEKKIEPADI